MPDEYDVENKNPSSSTSNSHPVKVRPGELNKRSPSKRDEEYIIYLKNEIRDAKKSGDHKKAHDYAVELFDFLGLE